MKHIIIALVAVFSVASAQQGHLIPNPIRNIPKWVRTEFASRHFEQRYTITYQRYPACLQGDFNGDKRKDVAIQIEDNETHKQGIIIFHALRPQAERSRITVIGAGTSIGKGTENLKAMMRWFLVKRDQLGQERHHPPTDAIRGDVIKLRSSGSTAIYIYWNGKGYSTYETRS